MKRPELQRKWRLLCLYFQIAMLTAAMKQEPGLTHRWKGLSRDRDRLIQERNQIRTLEDLRKIEKRRGLS